MNLGFIRRDLALVLSGGLPDKEGHRLVDTINELVRRLCVAETYLVADLPVGASGMKTIVTDATATTFASAVAGGGSNTVPVYYDASASLWRIG